MKIYRTKQQTLSVFIDFFLVYIFLRDTAKMMMMMFEMMMMKPESMISAVSSPRPLALKSPPVGREP